MTYGTENHQDPVITLPITQAARKTAQQFACNHTSTEKAEQIQMNTLAALTVNDYMQMQSYNTDLTSGDLWNPMIRLIDDVADLEVIGLGRIECRYFKPGEITCPLPLEVQVDRIAYVGVEIDPTRRQAKILGFYRPLDPEEIVTELHRTDLRSPDEFIDYLYDLECSRIIDFRRWLEECFYCGWNPTEQPLTLSKKRSLARRTEAFKEVFLKEHHLILVVGIEPSQTFQQLTESWDIFLQVRSLDEQSYLPMNLQMLVVDDATGEVVIQDQSQETESMLQLELTCDSGDRFSVKLILEDAVFNQTFAV